MSSVAASAKAPRSSSTISRNGKETGEAKSDDADPDADRPFDLGGVSVVCAGARGNLDDAAAAMLAQLLERCGAEVRTLPHEALQTAALRGVDLGAPAAIVLSYLNADSLAHARFLIRRLKRRLPGTRTVVGFWTFSASDADRRDPLEATRADSFAMSLAEALEAIAGCRSSALPQADAAEILNVSINDEEDRRVLAAPGPLASEAL